MKSCIKLLIATLLVLHAGFGYSASRPNIVYILIDNWGWGDLSAQGGTIHTANIDEFARQGLRLTNFNVQNQCTPTRSVLQTGRLYDPSEFARPVPSALIASVGVPHIVETANSIVQVPHASPADTGAW